MKKIYTLIAGLAALLCSTTAGAQHMYVSANLLDYINLGTINGEIGLSPGPKYSFYARVRYNPFTFNLQKQIQNRVVSVALGTKYWFWYSNAGWFASSHIGASVYNTAGIFDKYAYEGVAYGLTVGGGYSFMLNERLNLDLGLGVQGGYTSYTRYACPSCGKIEESGKNLYVAASNMLVQLTLML